MGICINIPADRKLRSQNARFQKKILFSLQRNTQFDRQNLAKFGRANLAKFAFRVGFLKMCKTLFHPLSDQAFQRRDSFLLEATVSIDISPLPALDIQEKIFAFWTQWIGNEVLSSRPCSINGSSMATDLPISLLIYHLTYFFSTLLSFSTAYKGSCTKYKVR